MKNQFSLALVLAMFIFSLSLNAQIYLVNSEVDHDPVNNRLMAISGNMKIALDDPLLQGADKFNFEIIGPTGTVSTIFTSTYLGHAQTENGLPHAGFGDASGNYIDWIPPLGIQIDFTASYYDATWGGGNLLGSDSFTIEFVHSAPTTTPSTGFYKRINCGLVADAVYNGLTYDADNGVGYTYTGNSQYTNGHGNFTLPGPFSPARYDQGTSMSYEFDVTNGQYRVVLLFAEPFHGTDLAGTSDSTRLFNVDIDGSYLVNDLNVYTAAGGANKVYMIDQVVTVGDGKLTLTFSEGSGNDPIINAIEVLSQGSGTIDVTSIALNPTSLNLSVSGTSTITPTVLPSNATDPSLNWASSNASVATVNGSGLVTAIAEGTATITGTSNSNGSISASASVTVTNSSNPPSGDAVWSESTSNPNNIYYNDGNVGIGTLDPGNDWKLAVNGNIRAKEIKVESNWADYVFEESYDLPTLEEVEKHIKEKGHLINIPSAEEVQSSGVELGEMNKLLLEKIEELTLYILDQNKELKKQKTLNIKLIQRLETIENHIGTNK